MENKEKLPNGLKITSECTFEGGIPWSNERQ